MASEKTTKKNAAIANNPSRNQMTLHVGDRYFCSICQDKGIEKEDWGTPAHICHHCGRAFCAHCAPTLGGLMHFFFQHQEVKWMHGRGQRLLPGQRRLEPAHCDECVHYAPRIVPWSFLGLGLSSLLFLPLSYITGWSVPQLFLPIALLWVLWVAWGITWHSIDSWVRQKLFFPIDGGKPMLLLQEFLEADGVLDGIYEEKFREGGPYGQLEAIVPLDLSMIEEMDRFASAHHLSEDQLMETEGVAGFAVMEKMGSVLKTQEVWDNQGCRRWELAAPLPQWPLLWDMKEDALTQKIGPFKYDMKWRPWLPFPVQVQAHFPVRSDRQTLELLFTLAGGAQKWNPLLLKLVMKPDEHLPPFKLWEVQGRSILHEESGEVEVNELQFDGDTARLKLRFEEPPIEGDEEAWISGSVKLLVPGKTISGAKIAAYYNAFGNLVEKPRTKILCWIDLHFKINVAKVPYQRISEDVREFVLKGTSAQRDDLILKALNKTTQVIRAHERVHRAQLLSYGGNALPPTREVVGRWPVNRDDDMLQVVYEMYLMPKEHHTEVQIRVEAPVNSEELYLKRAQKYGKWVEQIIQEADQKFWAQAKASEESTIPLSPEGLTYGRRPGLLEKMRER